MLLSYVDAIEFFFIFIANLRSFAILGHHTRQRKVQFIRVSAYIIYLDYTFIRSFFFAIQSEQTHSIPHILSCNCQSIMLWWKKKNCVYALAKTKMNFIARGACIPVTYLSVCVKTTNSILEYVHCYEIFGYQKIPHRRVCTENASSFYLTPLSEKKKFFFFYIYLTAESQDEEHKKEQNCPKIRHRHAYECLGEDDKSEASWALYHIVDR